MTWDDKLVEHITAEVLRRLERPSQKPRLFLLSDTTASDLTSYLKGYFSVHPRPTAAGVLLPRHTGNPHLAPSYHYAPGP